MMDLVLAALLAQYPTPNVSADMIENHHDAWLTYSGNWAGHRHSPLKQITPANVGQLRVKWAYQFRDGNNQTTPLVVNNMMFVSGPNSAAALDLRTGRPLWNWSRPVPGDYQSIGFGRTNRGMAILGDMLYIATLDCYLVALDAQSGKQRWAVKAGDYKLGYSFTVAPLALMPSAGVLLGNMVFPLVSDGG